jgi:hypothetical protein
MRMPSHDRADDRAPDYHTWRSIRSGLLREVSAAFAITWRERAGPSGRQPRVLRSAMVVRYTGFTHLSDERRRRQPGQAAGFVGEVRLVRVAMLDGEFREALIDVGVRHGEQLLEAHDPLKRLRPVANRRQATAKHLSFGQADEMPDVGKPLRVLP